VDVIKLYEYDFLVKAMSWLQTCHNLDYKVLVVLITPSVDVSSDAPNIRYLLLIFEESKEAPKLPKELRVQEPINFDNNILWELI
jgi:hypothetical protein